MPSEDGASGTTMGHLQLCMHLFLSSAVTKACSCASWYKEFCSRTHTCMCSTNKSMQALQLVYFHELQPFSYTDHDFSCQPKGLVHQHSGFYDERVFKREDCMHQLTIALAVSYYGKRTVSKLCTACPVI